jgi:hypothetical protein
VLDRDLGPFTTWEQGFDWNGRDASGDPLPDGLYTVRIEAEAPGGGGSDSARLAVRIDSSIVLLFRSLWSGSAGLLYTPSTDLLAGGSVQLSTLVLFQGAGGADDDGLQAPINFGLRAGLSRRNLFELDASVGGIIGYSEEDFGLPWFASAAFKASLFDSSGSPGLSSIAQVKLTYQNASSDTLTNLTGLSVGIPTGVHWGSMSLIISPEVILAPWTVSEASDSASEPGLYGWAYGRFGLLLDLSPFSFGASVALRTLPFHQGFGLGRPLQSAVEAHWLIPGTQLFLSLYGGGRFDSVESVDPFGGLGVGLLN